MKNITIEKVGDIHFDYPYLELFINNNMILFLTLILKIQKQ